MHRRLISAGCTIVLSAGFLSGLSAAATAHAQPGGRVRKPTINDTIKANVYADNWYAVDFDDSDWGMAKEYSEQDIDPKQPYFDADFKGAMFIWTDDLLPDNTVLFRRTIPGPPDGRRRSDFTNLNNSVPEGPPKPAARQPGNRHPRSRIPGNRSQ